MQTADVFILLKCTEYLKFIPIKMLNQKKNQKRKKINSHATPTNKML